MKKQKHNKKILSKSKQEFVDEAKELKVKFATELSEIVDLYYRDYLNNNKKEHPTISPIEIIGTLDFLKMDFFNRHKNFIILAYSNKIKVMNQDDTPKIR